MNKMTNIWKCQGSSLARKKSWFLKWILKKRTLEDISEESGYSISTLQRIFEKYLNNLPIHKITPNENAFCFWMAPILKKKIV
jgi:hypothetical protein